MQFLKISFMMCHKDYLSPLNYSPVCLKSSAYSLEDVLELREIDINYQWGVVKVGWTVCFAAK